MKNFKILAWALILLALAIPAHAATQFDFLLSQVRTSTTALIGGEVYFYQDGTTTPQTVWLDRNQGTVAANPYTLDSNATAQIYGAGIYRIVIKDLYGVTRFDRGGISTAGAAGTLNAIDATSGNQTFLLPSAGIALVCKTDSTSNTVTITPSIGGQTIVLDPLSVQGECANLVLSGTTWLVE